MSNPQAVTPTDEKLDALIDVMLTAQRNYDNLTSMRFGLNPVADSVLDAAHEGIRAARAALRAHMDELRAEITRLGGGRTDA